MTCTAPVVSRITAHYCGRCGRPIMFDPGTLRPWHVPPVPEHCDGMFDPADLAAMRALGHHAAEPDPWRIAPFGTIRGDVTVRATAADASVCYRHYVSLALGETCPDCLRELGTDNA